MSIFKRTKALKDSSSNTKLAGRRLGRVQTSWVLMLALLFSLVGSVTISGVAIFSQPAHAATGKRITPNNSSSSSGGNNQTTPPNSGENDDAAEEQNANEANEQAPYTDMVTQLAEQDIPFYNWLNGVINTGNQGSNGTDTYQGLQYFFNSTIGLGWLPNIGDLLAKWFSEIVTGWVAPVGAYLSGWVMEFVFNPDVSIGTDQFSRSIQTLSYGVRDLSNDLLLLFFIFGIWRYWTQAAWGGGQTMLSAVGRIIATEGLIIAWPTLYHYAILISNACINVFVPIQPNSQYANELGMAVFNAIKAGLTPLAFDWVSIPQTLAQFPNVGITTTLTSIASTVAVSFVGLIVTLLLLSALLVGLVSFLILKITQLVTIIAAFVFGPFFLTFLVSPDTEGYTSNFVTSFLEVSLWTFIWAGFLRMLILILQLP